MRKIVNKLVIAVAALAPLLFISPASALSNLQFTLQSDPNSAVIDFSHITTPPQIGEPLTITENVTENGQPAGTAVINCHVIGFTTDALLLDCIAQFNLANGTLQGRAIFLTSQHDYPGFDLSGTGAYQGVVGTLQIHDQAPGNETYTFNLFRL